MSPAKWHLFFIGLNELNYRNSNSEILPFHRNRNLDILWFSSTLSCDFWILTVITDDFTLRAISDVLWSYHRIKHIVEEIESIMGAQNWVHPREFVLHRNFLILDFWSINSLRWTPFHIGSHDEFSIYWNSDLDILPFYWNTNWNITFVEVEIQRSVSKHSI